MDDELVFLLDDVYVLHAVALAGTHHCADVLGLEQVLDHDGEVARAVLEHFKDACVAFLRDEGAQIGEKLPFLFYGQFVHRRGGLLGTVQVVEVFAHNRCFCP